MSHEYSEKLRDPRWQRKRLECMNAAGWACEICKHQYEELMVHHKVYRRSEITNELLEPWEYPQQDLQCLCKTCHTLKHLQQVKVAQYAEHEKLLRVTKVVRISSEEFWKRPRNIGGYLDEQGKHDLLALGQEYKSFIRDATKLAKAELAKIVANSIKRQKSVVLGETK
jgi:hypothetical protein